MKLWVCRIGYMIWVWVIKIRSRQHLMNLTLVDNWLQLNHLYPQSLMRKAMRCPIGCGIWPRPMIKMPN